MPFLSIVHLRELDCPRCGARIADPGARSFIVDALGAPIAFDAETLPQEMTVSVACTLGHDVTLLVPNEVSAEETLVTPDGAPIAADAVLNKI